jgi:hypothetical protein
MSTPTEGTPVPPPAANPELSDQQTAQAADQAAVSADDELRQLVTEIIKASTLGFDPAQIRKGIITAVADTTTPPTVTLNMSGDTTVAVAGVRFMDNYSPRVNDTVLVGKQGTEVWVLGHIASFPVSGGVTSTGWTQASLAAGSHNGNSNGTVYYRKVLDNGAWKMQWQGGWNVSGTTVISALAAAYRPAIKRSVPAARDADGQNVVKIDFNTDGSVNIVGGTTGGGSHSHTNSSTGSAGNSHSHSHGGSANPTSFSETHTHSTSSTGSAGSSTPSPTWVSFNGIEYFL